MTQDAVESDTIDADISCRRCGYNLRGLSESGRCPECGTPVGLSVKGDLLRYAEPRWVDTLARGLLLMFWGAVISVVLRVSGPFLGFYLPSTLPSNLIYFFIALIGVVGAWLVTEPDPSGPDETQYVSARRLVRIAVAIGMGYSVLSMAVRFTSVSPDVRVVMAILAACMGVVGVIGEAAKFKYLTRLARRIPNDTLAWWGRLIMWLYSTIYAASAAASATIMLTFTFWGIARRQQMVDFLWIMSVTMFAHIAMMIVATIYYARLRKAVRMQALAARRSWAVAEERAVRA